jgi:hypothetical protein
MGGRFFKGNPNDGKYWIQTMYGVIGPDGDANDYHHDSYNAIEQCAKLNRGLKQERKPSNDKERSDKNDPATNGKRKRMG